MKILLSAYIDGEVAEQERQMIEEHISVCPDCQETVTGFTKLHALYQELEIAEAPPGFRQRVTQRLETTPRFAFSWFSWRWPHLVYTVAFSLLVLLGGAIIVLHIIDSNQTRRQQASLDIDVYAEDILFDQSVFSINEIFSVEELSIAEEILDTMDFTETDTSLFFGDDCFSQNCVPHTFKRV
jgi:hypothetical protein